MEILTNEILYQKTSQELTALLYEGLLLSLEEAIGHIEDGDLFEANRTLQKASDIATRLGVGLKYEAGQMAENLEAIYQFVASEIISANVHKDTDRIQNVIQIIETLAVTWNEAMYIKNNTTADHLIKKVSAYDQNVMRTKLTE